MAGSSKDAVRSTIDQTRRAFIHLIFLIFISDLVEEICRWAVARLEDRRWTRVGHGLMIQKEIGEFRARIADARGLFQVIIPVL